MQVSVAYHFSQYLARSYAMVIGFSGLRAYALCNKLWVSIAVVLLGTIDPVTTLVSMISKNTAVDILRSS